MKKLLLVSAVVFTTAISAWADTVTGGQFNALSGVTISTAGGNSGTINSPFWNQGSDGTGNVATFLTAGGNFANQTQYVTTGTGQYYTETGSTANGPSNFSFLQGASTISVTVLFTNAGNNFGPSGGTQIGIYDVATGTKTALFGPGSTGGSLWNGSNDCIGNTPGSACGTLLPGVFNAGNGTNGGNNPGTATQSGVSTTSQWGIYAISCTNSFSVLSYSDAGCKTYYSGAAGGNFSGTNSGPVSPDTAELVNSLAHQHFALFNATSLASTFFVGFEDSFGANGQEGQFGDYNDVILQFTTNDSAIPEPSTLSILGLGLVGLGAFRKYRKS